MLKIIRFFIYIIIFAVYSCGSNQNDIISKNSLKSKYIPDSTSKNWEHYQFIQNIRSQLGLENLEHYCDSFEIRIYQEILVSGFKRVIVLKFADKKWSAFDIHLTSYNFQKDSNNLNLLIADSSICYFLKPKSSWNNLIDSLKLLRISELPDQTEITNFTDGIFDGSIYSFEISRNNFYKYYSYHSPASFKETENKSICLILDLIGRQFDLKDYELIDN